MHEYSIAGWISTLNSGSQGSPTVRLGRLPVPFPDSGLRRPVRARCRRGSSARPVLASASGTRPGGREHGKKGCSRKDRRAQRHPSSVLRPPCTFRTGSAHRHCESPSSAGCNRQQAASPRRRSYSTERISQCNPAGQVHLPRRHSFRVPSRCSLQPNLGFADRTDAALNPNGKRGKSTGPVLRPTFRS